MPSGVKAEIDDGIIDGDDIYYKDGAKLILTGTLSAGDVIEILGSQSNLKFNGKTAAIDNLTVEIDCEIPDDCELKVEDNKIICATVELAPDEGNLTDSALAASISRLKAFREYKNPTPNIDDHTQEVIETDSDVEPMPQEIEELIIEAENPTPNSEKHTQETIETDPDVEKLISDLEETVKSLRQQVGKWRRQILRLRKQIKALKSKLHK